MQHKKDTVSKKVKNTIATLPLQHKVGQLFMLAFPGDSPATLAPLIASYRIGGCYISQANAHGFSQAKALTNSLQKEMQQYTEDLPLLFGVDQEGAWGVLSPESTTGPGNLALGLVDDPALTRRMYSIFAREMAYAGYHCVLGPCADITMNPRNPIIDTRSFGGDPQRVSRHVDAAVKGIHDGGGIATAKHFPGHGDTEGDSHRVLPTVQKDLARLQREELTPFLQAVKSGVDILMTAHINFPALDPNNPATLSAPILSQYVREVMQFKGLIMTDSMNMGAMRKNYSPADATVRSLQAGADIIMLAEEHYDHSEAYLEKQIQSIEGLISAVETGKIPESVIDDRLSRILAFKFNRLVPLMQSTTSIDPSQNKVVEKEAARRSISLLRNSSSVWPLNPQAPVALLNATPVHSYKRLINARGIGPNQDIPAFESFATQIRPHFPKIQVFFHEQSDKLFAKIDTFSAVLAVTENYPLPGEDFERKEQISLVQKCIQNYSEKLIVVGLCSAYELQFYPNLQCYICSFSSRTCSAEAMAWAFLNPESVPHRNFSIL